MANWDRTVCMAWFYEEKGWLRNIWSYHASNFLLQITLSNQNKDVNVKKNQNKRKPDGMCFHVRIKAFKYVWKQIQGHQPLDLSYFKYATVIKTN